MAIASTQPSFVLTDRIRDMMHRAAERHRNAPACMRHENQTRAYFELYDGLPLRERQARSLAYALVHEPVRIFPHEIIAARPFLERLEHGLTSIADRPSLLLWADKDFAFRAEERRRWQQILTTRTDYTLHGAGHYWQDDAGEEAALVIRDWWDTAFG